MKCRRRKVVDSDDMADDMKIFPGSLWNIFWHWLHLLTMKYGSQVILTALTFQSKHDVGQMPPPPRPAKSRPCPAPQNLRNPRGAAGQNWLQIPLIPLFMTPTKDALKDERVGKSFHFTLFSEIPFKSKRR